ARISGFALVSLEPRIGFWFLDYIAASLRGTGGVGGALYARLREEAASNPPTRGLFFECPPDEPEKVADKAILKQNAARMRFYENFGVRPLVGNAYDLPISEGQLDLPYLMYDDLDTGKPLRREDAKTIVRAILERKYGDICTPQYINEVVSSFRDDPVAVRAPKYVPVEQHDPIVPGNNVHPVIALVINDKHDIHHIKERGYVEAPARISAILKEIQPTGLFHTVKPRDFGERHIRAIHADDLVNYLQRACATVGPGKSVYPYVFPIRNQSRPPKELTVRAGYYCIDTFTPLNNNAYPAAKRGVDCTLTAADELLKGERLAYALVRPPGHHAERKSFGGFCYFCNAGIAAQYLTLHGRVAILDIDYHHGNGQEEIFYERSDVLTVSIHGHPSFAYPYFSGFEEDTGDGPGKGYNLNIPLPETIDPERYRKALRKALNRIEKFEPRFLIVAFGLDPAKGDPTGTWTLGPKDFEANGKMIGALRLPTLVVQEGGYRTRTLGVNAKNFFIGLVAGQTADEEPIRAPRPNHANRRAR
ncbi:MAG: histone deacetylase family protein, partial [Phycisphaerae bacterium]